MKILLSLCLSLLAITLNAQSVAYEIRERIAAGIEALEVPAEPVHRVSNKEISGGEFSVKVRLYYPTEQEGLPILYFIHGGGWFAGSLETHDNLCRHLANATQSLVIAVDYRRPPEYPYPVPLEDSHFILHWINTNAALLKGNGDLYLIGDSAGANLVTTLAIKNLESDSMVEIKGQVLINPATDLRDEAPKYSKTPHNGFIDWYVPQEVDRSDPLLSPITYEHFEDLPKTIIVVGEEDPIRTDGVRFHQRMLDSGNSSVLFELKGVGHLGMHGAANAGLARPAIEFVTRELLNWME